MKYLIIGSGGREHVLAWRLLTDGSADEVYVAPGNGGIDERYRLDIAIDDYPAIEKACRDKMIDMVIVGPEAPLTAGLVDYLQKKNIRVFGPAAAAARLEGSKLFAKLIMEKYGVPTGYYKEFSGKQELITFINTVTSYPVVIKLDGLAAGKGVGIPNNREEAMIFIDEMVKDTTKVFVEEFLDGEEASILGISDGTTVKALVSAQDHKRIFDGDRGPNTGGMGAYAPAPVMTSERMNFVLEKVLKPVVNGMATEGTPFKGILYAGCIVCNNTIKVLEFNVRFGDPEAQVILPLLGNQLGEILNAAVDGTLDTVDIHFNDKHAITVVMASGGYPGTYEKEKVIHGLEAVSSDITVFHAGTSRINNAIVTAGGRVLNVTTMADSLEKACVHLYSEIDKITFEGAQYRKDIAYRALKR